MKLLEQQIEDIKLGNALQNRTVSELVMSPDSFLDNKKTSLRTKKSTFSGGQSPSISQISTGVLLPSDKTQEKAAMLLKLVASLQAPAAQDENSDNQIK